VARPLNYTSAASGAASQQAGVAEVELGCFDLPLAQVLMPGLQLPQHELDAG